MTRSRWPTVTAAAVTLLLLVAMVSRLGHGAPRTLSSPATEPPPASAALLRRLAESADAYRTGDTIYLVAADSAPYYPVAGGFPSDSEARTVAARLGSRYHVWATLTPADIRGQERVILTGCYKNDITTQYICPKTPGLRALRMSEVRDIQLIYELRNGESMRVQLSGDSISMAVFTLDAFDRFVAPYYLRLFGPEYVGRLRASMLEYAATVRNAPR